jgi:hypothetical protein
MKATNSKIKIYHWISDNTLILFEIEAFQRQKLLHLGTSQKEVWEAFAVIYIYNIQQKQPFKRLAQGPSNNSLGFLAKTHFFNSKIFGSASTKTPKTKTTFDL